MRGISLVLALAAFHAPAHQQHICTAQQFKPFSAKVWSVERWQRGAPKRRTLSAQREMLRCAGPRNRKAMKDIWRRDKHRYYAHRAEMRWFSVYRSFEYPDGSHWAVPYPIAWCESGGDYYASSAGAYGLTEGGGFPQNMPPKMQDEYAYRAYEAQGEAPWAPFEGGCIYR